MNKSETIILFQRLLLEIEKIQKKQTELSEQQIVIGKTIVQNQNTMWERMKKN